MLYNKHSEEKERSHCPLPSYHFTSSQDIKKQINSYRLAKEISGSRKARFMKELARARARTGAHPCANYRRGVFVAFEYNRKEE